eukprot:Hpha_TRINITY_DN15973_c0_g9::TRINITY_DN15973_c0_g9_i1::g.74589::m.74589
MRWCLVALLQALSEGSAGVLLLLFCGIGNGSCSVDGSLDAQGLWSGVGGVLVVLALAELLPITWEWWYSLRHSWTALGSAGIGGVTGGVGVWPGVGLGILFLGSSKVFELDEIPLERIGRLLQLLDVFCAFAALSVVGVHSGTEVYFCAAAGLKLVFAVVANACLGLRRGGLIMVKAMLADVPAVVLALCVLTDRSQPTKHKVLLACALFSTLLVIGSASAAVGAFVREFVEWRQCRDRERSGVLLCELTAGALQVLDIDLARELIDTLEGSEFIKAHLRCLADRLAVYKPFLPLSIIAGEEEADEALDALSRGDNDDAPALAVRSITVHSSGAHSAALAALTPKGVTPEGDLRTPRKSFPFPPAPPPERQIFPRVQTDIDQSHNSESSRGAGSVPNPNSPLVRAFDADIILRPRMGTVAHVDTPDSLERACGTLIGAGLDEVKRHQGVVLTLHPAVLIITFNSHHSVQRHAGVGARCAQRIVQRCKRSQCRVHAGVSCAALMAGYVGDSGTKSLAVVGTPLRQSRVLCFASEKLRLKAAVDEGCFDRMSRGADQLQPRPVDIIHVVGLGSTMCVYELLEPAKGAALCTPLYVSGFLDFAQRRLDRAIASLGQHVAIHPNDRQALRILQLATNEHNAELEGGMGVLPYPYLRPVDRWCDYEGPGLAPFRDDSSDESCSLPNDSGNDEPVDAAASELNQLREEIRRAWANGVHEPELSPSIQNRSHSMSQGHSRQQTVSPGGSPVSPLSLGNPLRRNGTTPTAPNPFLRVSSPSPSATPLLPAGARQLSGAPSVGALDLGVSPAVLLLAQNQPQPNQPQSALRNMMSPDSTWRTVATNALSQDPFTGMVAREESDTACVIPRVIRGRRGGEWLRLDRELGRGGFGKVFTALDEDGGLVALKTIPLPPIPTAAAEKAVESLLTEVEMLSALRHECVVTYLGSAVHAAGFVFVAMEMLPGGSLQEVAEQCGALPVGAVQRYTRDMLRGLEFLHGSGVTHRDLKPGNVLLQVDGQCKIADFGASIRSKELHGSRIVGTPIYMSPEACRGEQILPPADIWAVGVTVARLLMGRVPYDLSALSPAELVRRVGNGSTKPNVDEAIGSHAYDMCCMCTENSPPKRPTAAQLRVHAFCHVAVKDPEMFSSLCISHETEPR